MDTFNPYEVLGVAPKAPLAVIKAAHRALARKYHPDLHPGHADACAAVNRAWDLLSDPAQRRTVDRLLKAGTTACARCGGAGGVLKQAGFNKKVPVTCPACNGTGITP